MSDKSSESELRVNIYELENDIRKAEAELKDELLNELQKLYIRLWTMQVEDV
jgi:hypothetical protein|tara:strand:- start:497 stop:652 length:156 start_codon:yes stop_codon:yes gene_type:complete